jgi:hypothetical protein
MTLGRCFLSLSLLALACGSRTESLGSWPDEGLAFPSGCFPGVGVTAAESKALACGGECRIKSCSTGPCGAELVAEDADSPLALAVGDGGTIYWSTGLGGAIRQLSPGGAITELAKVGGMVRGLALRAGRLYWTAAESESALTTRVGSMLLPSGAPATLELAGNLVTIGLSGTRAFFADFGRGVVAVPSPSGLIEGTPQRVAGWSNAFGISVVGERVFWSQLNLDNSIRYFDQRSPRQTHLLACHQQSPGPLVADQQSVYWINRDLYETDGRIMVQGLSESFPRVLLARDELENRSLAGSDTHLYWVEAGTRIMRLQK